MVLSDEAVLAMSKRILLSRMRLLCTHGFFGLLLMHMRFSLDEEVETACTDGERISFGPAFLDSLSDSELDFILMHEIMHVVLQHCLRYENYDAELFNIACDIVVNSNILLENNMNLSSITLKKYGKSMHLTPDGEEGYRFTAEEVYGMLTKRAGKKTVKGDGSKDTKGSRRSSKSSASDGGTDSWDDHSRWGNADGDEKLRDLWVRRLENAAKSISIRDPSDSHGTLPLFARRMLNELHEAQTDWRQLLSDFVQVNMVDYSFCPPDRRFDDSPFYLPDLNVPEERVEDVLFMIDTSGSMSDKMITVAYSEVKGALDQFDGRLCGYLGFFDAEVVEPKPFTNDEELNIIRPFGGGGTSFTIIFDYVRNLDKKPSSIIILTDGIAPFPKEGDAMDIPVLWIINNDKVNPPWGRVARIKSDVNYS